MSAEISGFTVISGSRILVPTEIATIDPAAALPVVGTMSVLFDIATVQTIAGTVITQEMGGTITATVLGTVGVSVKETVGLQPGGTIIATILGSVPASLNIRGYALNTIIATLLTGTNPATIVGGIADVRGYYQKLITIYFTGTITSTVIIQAGNYTDSTLKIPYTLATITVVGTVLGEDRKYEALTDNWGFINAYVITGTTDVGTLRIELDKQV